MWPNPLFYSRSFLILSLFCKIRLQSKKDILNPICPLTGLEKPMEHALLFQPSELQQLEPGLHGWQLYVCFAH